MTTKHSHEIKTLHDVELLSSYKNVTEFLKFQSYVDIEGEKMLWEGVILSTILLCSQSMFHIKFILFPEFT